MFSVSNIVLYYYHFLFLSRIHAYKINLCLVGVVRAQYGTEKEKINYPLRARQPDRTFAVWESDLPRRRLRSKRQDDESTTDIIRACPLDRPRELFDSVRKQTRIILYYYYIPRPTVITYKLLLIYLLYTAVNIFGRMFARKRGIFVVKARSV